MDIAQDHKHHRKTQQRIQTKNKAHGDRGRGEILLYPPRLYCSKNGTALEVKPHWKGAQKPASLEDFGAVKIYTIYLTLPCCTRPIISEPSQLFDFFSPGFRRFRRVVDQLADVGIR